MIKHQNTNMTIRTLLSAACIAAMAAAAPVHAGSQTNTMTNIVTFADACDIAAIGIDFGVNPLAIPAGGITSVNANTSTGNAVTGNTDHPNAAADGGAANDDTLSLTTGVAAVDTAISTALSTVIGNLPGVYVACTATPTAITVTSSAAGSTPYSLPVTVGGVPAGNFAGKMAGVGGGAGAANTVDYTITFTGTPATSDPAGLGIVTLFIAAYTASGTIPQAQTGTVVSGFYADAAVAQVDF